MTVKDFFSYLLQDPTFAHDYPKILSYNVYVTITNVISESNDVGRVSMTAQITISLDPIFAQHQSFL